jgi:hypothetical protein
MFVPPVKRKICYWQLTCLGLFGPGDLDVNRVLNAYLLCQDRSPISRQFCAVIFHAGADYLSNLVYNMVTPGKSTRKPNGKLGVCMDPRYLNSFLPRATYALPDVECVFPKFWGAKFFSKMDMTAGFWQVLLVEAGSRLCPFSTPFGRNRYLRLPFGIAPAPELFHQIVGDVLSGMTGVMHFVDDVLVWGKTQEEHDQRSAEVLKRFQEVGFTFNQLKCEFSKPPVLFLGHLVDGQTV